VDNGAGFFFGAAVGMIAGRTVTRHGASNFAIVPEATRNGVAMMFVRTHAGEMQP